MHNNVNSSHVFKNKFLESKADFYRLLLKKNLHALNLNTQVIERIETITKHIIKIINSDSIDSNLRMEKEKVLDTMMHMYTSNIKYHDKIEATVSDVICKINDIVNKDKNMSLSDKVSIFIDKNLNRLVEGFKGDHNDEMSEVDHYIHYATKKIDNLTKIQPEFMKELVKTSQTPHTKPQLR